MFGAVVMLDVTMKIETGIGGALHALPIEGKVVLTFEEAKKAFPFLKRIIELHEVPIEFSLRAGVKYPDTFECFNVEPVYTDVG